MLVVMKSGSPPEDVERVLHVLRALGGEARAVPFHGGSALAVTGGDVPADPGLFEGLPGVECVLPVSRPLHRALRAGHAADTAVRLGTRTIGGGGLTLIAGPCAVEGEEQLLGVARRLAEAGADLLRAGVYKPRTSPYEFQGLGRDGVSLLARAREQSGLPVVSEAVDEASLALLEECVDVIQIGARNMQNFALLKAAGRCSRPVFLKRGPAATLEELLLAAEYVLDAGNARVILCERGIRTFSTHSRYTLDLAVVPLLKRLSHLPVFVDPSHASGRRESVAPLARAAVAAGADGVMVEVHPDPAHARCDGPQSLLPDEFAVLAAELRGLGPRLDRPRETVS
ncbi:MAG TPA: 3-deoxy-7-phosphoheptulonate synthase [Candidatus Polarisedimenticolaceae bacterium]|nr:3-deoxy-7-phosphoheptulonate synthase [Candidatus Polarisedimenticolaceae bacterium]